MGCEKRAVFWSLRGMGWEFGWEVRGWCVLEESCCRWARRAIGGLLALLDCGFER